MRALRDMNLPKFVFEDVPLFLGLISDLFPGLDCPRVRYPNFNDAVEAVLEENKYILLPHQVREEREGVSVRERGSEREEKQGDGRLGKEWQGENGRIKNA